MTCDEYKRLLNQQDGPGEDERASMREHMTMCDTCAEDTIRLDLTRLDEDIEVPDSFAAAWRRQIREDQPMENQTRKQLPWRGWLAAAAAVVFLIGGTLGTRDLWIGNDKPAASDNAGASVSAGYGASFSRAATMNDAAADEPYVNFEASSAKMAADTGAENTARAAKVIREASFTLKTQAFDDDYQALLTLTADLGGRVEYSSVSGDASAGAARVARLTLRVPTDSLDAFLTGAEHVGNLTNMTQSSEDVSDDYYDLQSRLDAQNAKMKRLIELMGMTENVADLIEVESAVADTQYLIDSYQSRLKGYDSRVDDSAVTVTLREVKVSETVEATLGDKIGQAIADSADEFVQFLEDMLVFLLAALPWLLAAAAVTGVIVVIIKKKRGGK